MTNSNKVLSKIMKHYFHLHEISCFMCSLSKLFYKAKIYENVVRIFLKSSKSGKNYGYNIVKY